jgi:transposase
MRNRPRLVLVIEPLLEEIESLNQRIKEYDERMQKIAKEVYPEVSLLKQVKGAGTQIALAYVLTIEDPQRFPKSREVDCFLGLRPGRRNSRESEPRKKSAKKETGICERLMVQSALHREGGRAEVDNQVAAPAETRTPTWHRANIAHQERGWKDGDRGGLAE